MSDVVRIDPHSVLTADPDHPGQSLAVPFRGFDPRLTAGIWAADEGELDIESYPVDEVCVVLTGTITVTTVEGVQEFDAGSAFGIRRGAALRWRQSDGTRKVFVTLDSEAVTSA
jgi:uncharacterized cupin superfamily protein